MAPKPPPPHNIQPAPPRAREFSSKRDAKFAAAGERQTRTRQKRDRRCSSFFKPPLSRFSHFRATHRAPKTAPNHQSKNRSQNTFFQQHAPPAAGRSVQTIETHTHKPYAKTRQ
jgi:hypothetical protein